jgi:hypothetical protein
MQERAKSPFWNQAMPALRAAAMTWNLPPTPQRDGIERSPAYFDSTKAKPNIAMKQRMSQLCYCFHSSHSA